MSRIVTHNDTIYLAGQVADDTSQAIQGQTRQVLDKIDQLLSEAGSDKSNVLSVTIWLADIADFAEMNAVWDQWVDKAAPPVRATCESRLARPDLKVEILLIAARRA
nr:RidA family protein [uncultured Paracoccus sp.]